MIQSEFVHLMLLDDAAFQTARTRHLARRPTSARTDNAGVAFVLSLFGAPTCLLLGLIKDDSVLMASSIFWLIVGFVLFSYLAFAARYWREHRAIIVRGIAAIRARLVRMMFGLESLAGGDKYTPNPSFQRTVKKLRFLPSAEFTRWASQMGDSDGIT